MNVIWAWSDVVPTVAADGSVQLATHGETEWGAAQLNLMTGAQVWGRAIGLRHGMKLHGDVPVKLGGMGHHCHVHCTLQLHDGMGWQTTQERLHVVFLCVSSACLSPSLSVRCIPCALPLLGLTRETHISCPRGAGIPGILAIWLSAGPIGFPCCPIALPLPTAIPSPSDHGPEFVQPGRLHAGVACGGGLHCADHDDEGPRCGMGQQKCLGGVE
jgi:hypothetical protein